MTSSQLGIIPKKLETLERLVSKQHDPILSLDRAAEYMDVSKSTMYKLSSTNQLPYHKPNGKLVYFRKSDLDAYVLQNRVSTGAETDHAATRFVNSRRFSISATKVKVALSRRLSSLQGRDSHRQSS